MEDLMKGKTILGKWYARPTNWAGIWKDEFKILVSGNTLFQADTEEEIDLYIDVYNLINLVKEQYHSGKNADLFVYKMDDCEWWVSDLSEEKTLKAYGEEYGISDEELESYEVKMVDLNEVGMYWDFDNEDIIDIVKKLLNGKRFKKIEIGNLIVEVADCYDYFGVWIPFVEAVKLINYKKPCMIATTEC